jgi:ADP-ribosylglycohydrolase
MLGAIAGDIIGSVHEHSATKSVDFPLLTRHSTFTDDTVLTVATAHAIVSGTPYSQAFREFGRRHPHAGYGFNFLQWLFADHPRPYNSWGNGSAMRVSPVGFAFEDEESVLREAERSAAVTHNHPERIKGAQATALAIFAARTGASRDEIRRELTRRFDYDLDRRIADIRPQYSFDVSCQGSVPQAIVAFLESTSVEDAIRLAISLGGDADTQAAIAGGIAHAFYGSVPDPMAAAVKERLPDEFVSVLDAFDALYPSPR